MIGLPPLAQGGAAALVAAEAMLPALPRLASGLLKRLHGVTQAAHATAHSHAHPAAAGAAAPALAGQQQQQPRQPRGPSAAWAPAAAAGLRGLAQAAYAEPAADLHAPPLAIPAVAGRIHSVDSFSAVDGPGVRLVVFTQGCSMRCKFCSNPDTWNPSGGEGVTSKDIASQLARLAPYLHPGGGGVTLSGGEPLLQPEFTAAVFQEAHALGLTTCLDTTGQGTKHHHWDVVLPHTDMALFCIKSLNEARYASLTGLRQVGALRFAAELKAQGVPFWMRYVLIPGETDAADDISRLVAFAQQQPTLQGIELLPYHLLGASKWRELGLRYPLEGVSPPPLADVLRVVEQLEGAGGINVICDAKRLLHAHAAAAAHHVDAASVL